MTEYQARVAALRIEEDCKDRRGIKWGFNDIDPEVRKEIILTWARIIMRSEKDSKK